MPIFFYYLYMSANVEKITSGKLVTVLVGESKNSLGRGFSEENKEGRSAPHYIGLVPPQKLIKSFEEEIDGLTIIFNIKGYEPDIVVVEGSVVFKNIFDEKIPDIKENIFTVSRQVLQKYNTYKNFDEEYGIFCVSQYDGQPEEFFNKSAVIAAFLKSEKEPLDLKEIQQTLEASIKYAKDDLLIVDWDGAFIFDSSGDFEETIEILEIANLQLLKYRILDFELDRRLNKLLKLLWRQQRERFSFFRINEVKEMVREIIQVRSQSMIEFEIVERNFKLIGDWYSARVYNLLEKKFHLDSWRKIIKDKFETLEDIYAMASENFNISFNKRIEIIMIFGWLILQIGWFILLFLEFSVVK